MGDDDAEHRPATVVDRVVVVTPSAGRRGSRRRAGGYGLVAAVVVAGMLLLFGLVGWAAVPIFTDPVPVMRRAGLWAALIGAGLLTVDVLLPVPSSLIMIAHGALFGLVPGAGFSILGGAGATLLGFLLGRRGRPVVERVTTAAQRQRADRLLLRWGALAILVTRPIPVVAETVCLLAGTSPMPYHVAVFAGAVGTVPPAVLYAAAGAAGGTAVGAVLVLGVVGLTLLLAAFPATRGVLARGRPHTNATVDGTPGSRAGDTTSCLSSGRRADPGRRSAGRL